MYRSSKRLFTVDQFTGKNVQYNLELKEKPINEQEENSEEQNTPELIITEDNSKFFSVDGEYNIYTILKARNYSVSIIFTTL